MTSHTLYVWMTLLTSVVTGYNYHYLEDNCVDEAPYGDIFNLTDGVYKYGIVRVTRNEQYAPNLDCYLTVVAPPDYYLTVRIRHVETYTISSTVCGPDYLQVLGYNSSELSVKYCGRGTPRSSLTSLTSMLTFRFVSGDGGFSGDYFGFDLHYTAFHRGECSESEHKCKLEDRCIPSHLTCDNMDNCGDWSDEKTSTCGLSTGAIIAIVVCSGLIVVSCGGFAIYYYHDHKKRTVQEREREIHRVHAQMIPAQQEALAVSPPTCQYPPGIEPPPAYTFTRMDPAYPPDEKIPPEERYGHAPGGVTNPAYATPEITTTPPPAPPGHTPAPYSMDAYTGGEAPVNSPPPVYEVIDTAYTHYRSDDQSTSAPGEVDPVSQSAVQLTTVDG